jgi:hypothetical protein
MALLTVEGIYKDGKVELTERPVHVQEAARVLAWIPTEGKSPSKSAGSSMLHHYIGIICCVSF